MAVAAKKKRMIFAVYVTDEKDKLKVEGVANAAPEEAPLIFQAMKVWMEAMAEHSVDAGLNTVGKNQEMMAEFSMIMKTMRELPAEESERLSKDVAQVLKGIRQGK